MRNSNSTSHSDHLRHDRLLVTRFAMGDSFPAEKADAQALVHTCSDCAALAADIQLIAASMQRLPQPRRPRDFQLTAEQARRAQGSAVGRFFRALGGPGWTTLRPVAGVAMSIGLLLAAVGATMPSYLAAPAGAPFAPSRASTEAPGEADLHTPVPQLVAGTTPPPAGAASRPPGPLATPGAVLPTDGSMSVDVTPPSVLAYPPTRESPDDTTKESGGTPAEPVAGAETQDPTSEQFNNAYVPPTPVAGGPDGLQSPAQPAPGAASTGALLILAGVAIAAFSFALLTLAWIARRRFSDPLLR